MRITISILLGFCSLMTSMVRAQETDRIKELTVENAKRLAKDKSGRQMFATLYRHLGIDPAQTTVLDPNNRAQYLLEHTDTIRELVG